MEIKYKNLGLGSTILQKVDEFLDEKQKSKEFKDVGKRVGGSKKEISAYKTVVFADLNDIEADDLVAQRLVTKERVYPVVDVESERAKGVSSGATYLKVEIRRAFAAKAPNSRYQRAIYVKFIERLVSDLSLCFNTDEILKTINGYNYLPETFFVVSNDEKERQEELKRISGRVPKFIKFNFGATVYNLFRGNSESASIIRKNAISYEAITEETARKNLKEHTAKIKELISNEKILKEKISELNGVTLKAKVQEILGIYGKSNNNNAEENRDFLRGVCDRRIQKLQIAIDNPPQYCIARPENWQWHEGEKNVIVRVKSNERQINSGIPLTHIKRTGGITIPDKFLENSKNTNTESNPITSVFGFKSVQFGNAIDDKTSREHARHFLAAVTDLAEILDIDLKQMNQIGDLSIAFASRGRGKYAAHYEPGAKIINMTNKRGDGSLAHEWGHYLDNILTMLDKPSERLTLMATECIAGSKKTFISQNSTSIPVFNALKEIMNFIFKGKVGVSKGYLMRYVAQPDAKSGRIYVQGSYEQIEPKGNAKETFDYWQARSDYFNVRQSKGKDRERQIEIIGRLVADLGLEYYDLFIPPKTSDFYASSSLMQSEYWTKSVELFARSWECYVFDKLVEKGRQNNYLVSSKYFDPTATVSGQKINVYPEGRERAYFMELYDNLINTLKREYNLKGFTPFSNIRKDEYIEFEDVTEGYNYVKIRKSLFEIKI